MILIIGLVGLLNMIRLAIPGRQKRHRQKDTTLPGFLYLGRGMHSAGWKFRPGWAILTNGIS